MELKTTSWHSKLYNYSYTSSLPNNLCSYFWKVILAMIVSPLSLPVGLSMRGENLALKTFVNIICLVCFCICSFAFIYAPLIEEDFIPMISILIIIGIGLLIYGFYNLVEYLDKRNRYKPKQPNIFIEYIKATKENYCPKITWKND